MQRASLLAQMVKNPPAKQETWVRSLGWEDVLEKEKATHSSTVSWKIPWTLCKELDTTEQLSAESHRFLHIHCFSACCVYLAGCHGSPVSGSPPCPAGTGHL